MAVKTQAQLLAEVASLLADNTTGNISALDVRTCLNDIIDSANYGGSKVYKALLTQTGTSAPVATVLVNTLSGTLVWSRGGVGDYYFTLASEFPDQNKLYFPPLSTYSGDGTTAIPIIDSASVVVGYYYFIYIDADQIGMRVHDTSGVAVELSTLITTSKLALPPIEVYP